MESYAPILPPMSNVAANLVEDVNDVVELKGLAGVASKARS